ncbi:MAG: SRPBCC family protein [Anaerolineae bacterium]|nr:SRPBCC family protein [Anaerolineae bacterium]MCO5187571.1 SRPBCC family protein [Anaerolineae bacterium]MCO5192411.1 SRPBCC family protein [Anaerolineae bacterium]MCO5198521.1 SRPBCC family protein [Anaerolineae bacterium]MCO5203887.1 SRPBCC family protein [Anaerolineae bacterium]
MAVVKRSIDIQAPAPMVWNHLTDYDRVLEWNKQYDLFSIVEDVPDNVGTRYVTMEKFRGKTLRNECVITEWVANRRFGFSGDSAEYHKEGIYTLEPKGDACRITMEITLTPKGGPMKKAASKLLVEKPYEVEVGAILTDLKQAVEAAYHDENVIRI